MPLYSTVDDFLKMSDRAQYLIGLPASAGGSGDSSKLTADGVVVALEATSAYAFGSSELRDKRVNLLGLGKVGSKVADALARRGARLTVADNGQSPVIPRHRGAPPTCSSDRAGGWGLSPTGQVPGVIVGAAISQAGVLADGQIRVGVLHR
jgi:hypothetical protein